MKKIFALTLILLAVTTVSYGQRDTSSLRKQVLTPQQKAARQQWVERRTDSAVASREVVRMKQLFSLTPDQEQALFRAGITVNQNRRGVFKNYWKTADFPIQMAKVDSAANVLYASIVGADNYKLYKESLHSRLVQRQQAMPRPVGVDSLHLTKPQQP